jgi:hypothetical protein
VGIVGAKDIHAFPQFTTYKPEEVVVIEKRARNPGEIKHGAEQPLEGGIEWFLGVDLTVVAVCIPSMDDPLVIGEMDHDCAVAAGMA